MARVIRTSGWSHVDDAAFRAWVLECEEMLEAAGFVRTADTGQINPATVVKAGANADAGFSTWRFDDSLQSVSPLCFRVNYGTAGSVNAPRMSIRLSQGTDGAGGVTGAYTSTITCSGNGSGLPLSTLRNSYATHSEGFGAYVGHLTGVGSNSNYHPCTGFVIQRTVDNNGAPTGQGAHVQVGNTNSTHGASTNYGQFARLHVTPTPVGTGTLSADYLGFIPGAINDSRTNLSPQIFLHWFAAPKMMPLVGSACYILTEVADEAQFQMALVGVTPRNYLAVGSHFARSSNNNNVDIGTAILWED